MAISADRSWTGEYILDFGRLLERSVGSAGEVDSDEDGQQPEFSLVTGQYRKVKRFGGVASPASDEGTYDVILRSGEGTVSVLRDSAAGAFLWRKETNPGIETTLQHNSYKIGRIADWRPEWDRTCHPCWSRGAVALRGDIRMTAGPGKMPKGQ